MCINFVTVVNAIAMRRTYTMVNGEIAIHEIRSFSATARPITDENDPDHESSRKSFSNSPENESLAVWSRRRCFTTATIDIRLREARKNLKERMRRIFNDYKRFADGKLKAEDLDNFVAMLDNELMILITTAADDIESGKSLTSVLGLGSLGGNLKSLGQKFTIAYRKSLKSLDSTGAVTPTIYRQVNETLNALIDEFHRMILGSEKYEALLDPSLIK